MTPQKCLSKRFRAGEVIGAACVADDKRIHIRISKPINACRGKPRRREPFRASVTIVIIKCVSAVERCYNIRLSNAVTVKLFVIYSPNGKIVIPHKVMSPHNKPMCPRIICNAEQEPPRECRIKISELFVRDESSNKLSELSTVLDRNPSHQYVGDKIAAVHASIIYISRRM